MHVLSLPHAYVVVKALCHAIRADCLLIETTRAQQWAWWMTDKFVRECSNLPTEACSVRLSRHRVGFLVSIYSFSCP